MVDIEQLTVTYFENDEPCPFGLSMSKNTLNIHPILVSQYHQYSTFKQIFEIRKNEINNYDIVTSSYLKFLDKYVFMATDGDLMKSYFMLFLEMIFKLDETKMYIHYDEFDRAYLSIVCANDEVYQISAKDLDDIIQISFHQNDPSYYDMSDMNPEFRRDLEEYYKLACSDECNPTFERQKIFVISKMAYTVEQVKKMTYRCFIQLYKMLVDNDMFFAQTMYKVSEKYDVKEKVLHPTSKNVTFRDRINEAFTSTDAIENKLGKIQ